MGDRNPNNGGKKRQQNEKKKDMPIQNDMPFKGKTLKSYKSNVMQTAVNYFSFVMEITEVDFSIFSYFWITLKIIQKKDRDENQASIYGKQMHASNSKDYKSSSENSVWLQQDILTP